MTNYVQLWDTAALLDGSSAQFNVDWKDQNILISSHLSYTTRSGGELFPLPIDSSGYPINSIFVTIDGKTTQWEGVVLKEQQGGTHTYCNLRELGKALGFTVSWDNAIKSIIITTDS